MSSFNQYLKMRHDLIKQKSHQPSHILLASLIQNQYFSVLQKHSSQWQKRMKTISHMEYKVYEVYCTTFKQLLAEFVFYYSDNFVVLNSNLSGNFTCDYFASNYGG